MKNNIEIVRKRICRKTFNSSTSTLNEASYIDLNWIDFNTECDRKLLKFFFKLQKLFLSEPEALDNFLF